jgi:hypothetical protein
MVRSEVVRRPGSRAGSHRLLRLDFRRCLDCVLAALYVYPLTLPLKSLADAIAAWSYRICTVKFRRVLKGNPRAGCLRPEPVWVLHGAPQSAEILESNPGVSPVLEDEDQHTSDQASGPMGSTSLPTRQDPQREAPLAAATNVTRGSARSSRPSMPPVPPAPRAGRVASQAKVRQITRNSPGQPT